MDPVTLGIILKVIEALVGFAAQVPEIVAAVQMIKTLIDEKRAPTPDEQAQIDAALDAAHKALQAA